MKNVDDALNQVFGTKKEPSSKTKKERHFYSIKNLTFSEIKNLLENMRNSIKDARIEVFITMNYLWIKSSVDLENYNVFSHRLVGSKNFRKLKSKPNPETRYKGNWSSLNKSLRDIKGI